MAKLKVIGDPAAAAQALKTNRPLEHGQVIVCADQALADRFAAMHPNLVTLLDGMAPAANKMLNKGRKFKSKRA